jgi:tetratricopeptide (TPR) repeat protein
VQASDRKEVLAAAINHGARARKLKPARVEGHYWYALSFISWSQEKGAWNLISNADDVKTALDLAVKADPSYFMAGPLRARGRLWSILPSFPFSFGDYSKSVQDLKKSIEIAPNAKISYLYLAKAALENEGASAARKVLESARKANATVGELEDTATRRALTELERNILSTK